MDFPVQVCLSAAEVAFVLSVATQRNARKPNPDSCLSKSHSGFGVHFAGAVGEVAFTKVHGGKISQQFFSSGDGHAPDIKTPDNRTVEVKTSLYSGPNVEMKIEGHSELDASDWFCLVQVTLPDRASIYPILSQSEVRALMTVKNYGYGDRLVVTAHSMLHQPGTS